VLVVHADEVIENEVVQTLLITIWTIYRPGFLYSECEPCSAFQDMQGIIMINLRSSNVKKQTTSQPMLRLSMRSRPPPT
jgi:hypothetical protein